MLVLKTTSLKGLVSKMKHMLAFEFRKLFTKKKLYIFLILILCMVLLTASMKSILSSSDIEGAQASAVTSFEFVKNAYSNAMMGILGGIFISIFVCEDAGNDYLKNIYAKGYHRFTVFFAKFISNLVAMFIMYIFAIVSNILIGIMILPSGAIPEGFALSLIVSGLLLVASTAFFFTISMFVSKLALAITFNIVAPIIISIILQVIDMGLKSTSIEISKFWIDNAITNVGNATTDGIVFLTGAVVAVIYTGILLVGGSFLCSKKDNK